MVRVVRAVGTLPVEVLFAERGDVKVGPPFAVIRPELATPCRGP